MDTLDQLRSQLSSFLEGRVPNLWLTNDVPSLEVYVRKGRRYIEGKVEHVFDIGNITVEDTGKGTGSQVIELLHSSHPFEITYIECIHNTNFLRHLLKNGWTLTPNTMPPSVYRRKT